jgi:sec-independent protein translocase protein TatA
MVGGSEILLIFLAILILFGAKKIPDFARSLGKGVNEFKKATEEIKNEINKSSSVVTDEVKNIKEDVTGGLSIYENNNQVADTGQNLDSEKSNNRAG